MRVPWIQVQPVRGGYHVTCSVCGVGGVTHQQGAEQFVREHEAHRSAAPGYMGAGDAVARVAKPVARAFGMEDCTPCEKRREALNRLVPRLFRQR